MHHYHWLCDFFSDYGLKKENIREFSLLAQQIRPASPKGASSAPRFAYKRTIGAMTIGAMSLVPLQLLFQKKPINCAVPERKRKYVQYKMKTNRAKKIIPND
jgi:hypothetical protein